MKGIRRAAAVCLTMTLAVSTLFGNTAWADMPQKTEKKKCVHVHTEECYGEPDEEATSSQIGEEPTYPRLHCRKRMHTEYSRVFRYERGRF